MAFSGTPITHSFGVTAFGGGGGGGSSATGGGGTKRRLEDAEESSRYITKSPVPKRPQKRRRPVSPYHESDDDDGQPTSRWSPTRGIVSIAPDASSASASQRPVDSHVDDSDDDDGQPTSMWSPTRGLVSIALGGSSAAVGHGPAGTNSQERQVTAVTKVDDQDDSPMGGMLNQTGSHEIVEISSDEESLSHNEADEEGNKHDLQQAGSQAVGEDNLFDLKSAKIKMKNDLKSLGSRLPGHCFAQKDKGGKYRIWVALVRYVDQLSQGTYMKRVNASKGIKAEAPREALMVFLIQKFGRKFDVSKKGKFLHSVQNMQGVLDGLKWYFEQHAKLTQRNAALQSATSFSANSSSIHDDRSSRESRDQVSMLEPASLADMGEETFIKELPPSGPAKRGHPSRPSQQPADNNSKGSSQKRISTGSTAPARPAQPVRATKTQQMTGPQGIPAPSFARSAAQERNATLNNRSQLAASNINGSVRNGGSGAGTTATRQSLNASNAVSSTSDVDASIGSLKSEISAAISMQVDWTNYPVALFETEMALKRLFTSLDRAKDAFAKSDGA